MSSTTDTDLRNLAEASLAEAQGIMGLPAIVVGFDVSGDGFWESLATRAKGLLDKARKYNPTALGAKAAGKVRDAARYGASKASDASDAVKATLSGIAASAAALALGPGALLMLGVFLLVESTGYGKRARAGARRYVDARAREYGF
jgi:hypothetical protein